MSPTAPGVVANSPAIAGTIGSSTRTMAAETKAAMARSVTCRAGRAGPALVTATYPRISL